MKTIWKFPIPIQDRVKIEIPFNHSILSVQEQDNIIALWAVVDPDSPKIPVYVRVYGKGHTVEDEVFSNYLFRGTVQTHEGRFVWHVFTGTREL